MFEKLWELVAYLALTMRLVVVPLYPHDSKYELKRGKQPLVAKWQKLSTEDMTELQLEKWKKKNPTANYGLVLGNPSGIIAIDVDGEEGNELLQGMCKGDLPVTVTFLTPGGGMRYLYKIPASHAQEHFRKYWESGQGQHQECALLGDGQQTVLPYSTHPNGGIYSFVEGKSFEEAQLADAPVWMIEKMLRPQVQEKNQEGKRQTARQINTAPTIKALAKKCRQLNELYRLQCKSDLYYDDRFLALALLVRTGNESAARAFADRDAYTAQKSHGIIEKLLSEDGGIIRCTTLGCVPDEIRKCQRYFEEHNGEIRNTPAIQIADGPIKNRFFGFYYDKDGNFKGLNGDTFARRLHERFPIRRANNGELYIYKKNRWKPIKIDDVKSALYHMYQRFEPNTWSKKNTEEWYFPNFLRQMRHLPKANLNYINFKNGLLNLETLELEPHRPDIVTYSQLDFDYDPDAQCPQFQDFLKGVSANDPDLCALIIQMLGYCCISRSTKAHKVFFLLGDGSNGKSVLIAIMTALTGIENIASVAIDSFGKKFTVCEIYEKQLNIASENAVGKPLYPHEIKAISAGDRLQLQFKGQNPFTYEPHVKLVFSMNRLPYTADRSYGFERRPIIIPFDMRFVVTPQENNPHESQLDRNMEEELMEELPGIFNLALQGLHDLVTNNYEFHRSDRAEQSLEEYKLELNPFLDFVRECIRPANPKERLDYRVIFDRFMLWCETNGHRGIANMRTRTFLRELRSTLKEERLYLSDSKSNNTIKFDGITIVTAMNTSGKGQPQGITPHSQKRKGKPSQEIDNEVNEILAQKDN